jgi:Spy/CpxP family protein refolding chaperone
MNQMFINLALVAITLLAAAAGAVPSGFARADDVAAQEQPGQPAPTLPADTSKPPESLDSGDRVFDIALKALNVTQEQAAALADILKSAREANKASAEEIGRHYKNLQQKLAEASAESADNATAQAHIAELQEQMRQLNDLNGRRGRQLRDRLAQQVLPLLGREQADSFRNRLADWSDAPDSPDAAARRLARMALRQFTDGIELTGPQLERAIAILIKHNEATHTRQEKAQRELRQLVAAAQQSPDDPELAAKVAKRQAQMKDEDRAARDAVRKAIEELFSPEQKRTVSQHGKARAARWVDSAVEAALAPALDFQLTDAQARKINGLGEAAKAAMNKLEPDNWAGREELIRQLRSDVASQLPVEPRPPGHDTSTSTSRD